MHDDMNDKNYDEDIKQQKTMSTMSLKTSCLKKDFLSEPHHCLNTA